MMNINFIAMGKLKEGYFREACAEYQKRLSAYVRVTVREPEPQSLPQNPSAAQISAALEREAKDILSHTGSGFNIALCVEGKQLSSERLAERIQDLGNNGISTVNFIVGSSFGLAESLKSQCQMRLSMSEMTFPHSLARVMLFEQVYRAFSIINNGKYHK
ncbi:MAG: 23S rRNA (pseudouridine(1915)-N(3))-methyltransferase RlmH [Oscillospiraceae bacterium]|nr:23S rRNA (pseudouridine(1915)-N(3))-methyltransferase RlmH [Oscillospiraceae bacterium]